ncbi:MAG: phosphoribosylaminoimidazolesuccinocarboxamide synthase [Gammaproteobacteria bacterium]|nr:MAG: phosphoribosylaminoimidazolesuccinocarboxamide synthase [Gammaproteobacteria bacterium]
MLFESNLKSLRKVYQGKVRDIYEVDDQHWLIVTSDRLSAFDVILPDPIPKKGMVLTSVSNFWFDRFSNKVKNHLSDIKLEDVIQDDEEIQLLRSRSVIVRKLKALPFEAIVRGYVIGSGWKEYQNTGAICSVPLPPNLEQAQKLDSPIFTPSTKAAVGDHDENVSFDKIIDLVEENIAETVKDLSIEIYKEAADFALQKGIIIADTKFEFGLDENDEIVLIDEALTPDSSRFWPQDTYKIGESPKSYDKQYVRDYLETLDWNKQAPGPKLPQKIIDNTSAKYLEACERLTGLKL